LQLTARVIFCYTLPDFGQKAFKSMLIYCLLEILWPGMAAWFRKTLASEKLAPKRKSSYDKDFRLGFLTHTARPGQRNMQD
jgi:hypothetical protein